MNTCNYNRRLYRSRRRLRYGPFVWTSSRFRWKPRLAVSENGFFLSITVTTRREMVLGRMVRIHTKRLRLRIISDEWPAISLSRTVVIRCNVSSTTTWCTQWLVIVHGKHPLSVWSVERHWNFGRYNWADKTDNNGEKPRYAARRIGFISIYYDVFISKLKRNIYDDFFSDSWRACLLRIIHSQEWWPFHSKTTLLVYDNGNSQTVQLDI